MGSGFIVDPLGTVVTSLHIVEGATAIRVKLASGLIYDHVRVRARETRTDLALLQLDGFGLPTVSLGDSDALRAGDPVVAMGVFAAIRTGSGEAVQGLFPLFFVFLFLSSMNLPRNLIETDWFRHVATYNPVSYLIEGIRSLLVTGWDGEALALGFGIAAAIAVLGMVAASAALKTRLVRT